MLEVLMGIFVFAMAAVVLGVALLTISACAGIERRTASLERAMALQTETLNVIALKAEKTTSAALKAAVDDLAAALDASRASNRRELGRLWAKIGGERPTRTFENGAALEGDDDLEALVAFQNAKPVQPQ